MKTMWHYVMRHKWLVFINFLCVFGFIIIELGLPTLQARMFDLGVMNQDRDFIIKTGIQMAVIVVIGIILHIMLSIVGARLNTKIVISMRNDMIDKIQHYSHHEYEKIGVSSLITRTVNDAFQVMNFLGMILRTGFMTPMMFAASLFMIIRTSPSLSAFVFVAVPLLLAGVFLIGKYSEPISNQQQKNLDSINGILRENLSGLRVVRAFVNESFEEQRFTDVNQAYTNSSKKLFKLMASALPSFFFLFNVVMALVIWFGAVQVDHGDLAVGNLIAFIEYIFHALYSFMMFATVFMMYPRAAVSAHRIQEVLDLEPTIKENPNGIRQTKTNGYIEFKDVTFAYPGHTESPVIRNVSFHAKPGETVAFIGSTGSGKSTMIQLIPRFFDVTRGQIIIDGVDVRDYALDSLRHKIGFIPQKATLFSGTIKENILYGKPDATATEIERALDISQAADFVSKKEKGLDEVIAEGGSNFSGGQKQRLAIARALIRKPSIYIFDDSFSALDYRTDAILRRRIKEEITDATILIVAQRVSTIMNADRIVVLNEGNVVAIGTHRELLKTCDIYYDIAASQLTKEELA